MTEFVNARCEEKLLEIKCGATLVEVELGCKDVDNVKKVIVSH